MANHKEPVRDDIAADIARIDRDLASRTKPGGSTRLRGDDEKIDALLEARQRLTELAAGLTTPTESVPEGSS